MVECPLTFNFKLSDVTISIEPMSGAYELGACIGGWMHSLCMLFGTVSENARIFQ